MQTRPRVRWTFFVGAAVLLGLPVGRAQVQSHSATRPTSQPRPQSPSSPPQVRVYQAQAQPPPSEHPRHVVKSWLTTYRGRTFRVTQLPRCEHLEAVISYEPRGQTKEQAMRRLGGMAVCTGSFHNPHSMSPADFLQCDGNVISDLVTGRWFLAVLKDGSLDISDNYLLVKGKSGTSVIALGQRLVPLHHDGFSTAFMNRVTDRMALGISKTYVFIVQTKSDIWTLSRFMDSALHCTVAINADGGHVVKGRSPAHIVFRWRTEKPPTPGQPAHTKV